MSTTPWVEFEVKDLGDKVKGLEREKNFFKTEVINLNEAVLYFDKVAKGWSSETL